MPRKSFKKKYRKTLKKSNIFRKTGAKSQAKQIYALKKKINYYSKLNRPEIHTHTGQIFNWIINMPNASSERHSAVAFYEGVLIRREEGGQVINPDGVEMRGDLMRIQNITIYGQFSLGSNINPNVQDDINHLNYSAYNNTTAYIKIIVCRLIYGGGRTPPRITQDGPLIGESGAYTDMTPINGPLINGIGKQMKIIYTKYIKIDSLHPTKIYKIKLNNKKIGNFKKFENWPTSYGMNEILIYYQYVAPSILIHRFDEQGVPVEQRVSPNTFFTMNYKCAYVDES